MATNAEIRVMLQTRYPQFASLDSTRIETLVEDARLMVPLCRLGDRADLALMYKTGALLSASLSTSATGTATGDVRRIRVGERETEYQSSYSGASGQSTSGRDFESLYANLVRPLVRNSPRVLGYNG